MAANWMRRVALALCAGATAMVLAACGSSSVSSALTPSRFIVFGDALSDVGQNGGKRYTVNDGSVNNWTLQLASRYGKTITPSSAGGLSYATGNARVLATPTPRVAAHRRFPRRSTPFSPRTSFLRTT